MPDQHSFKEDNKLHEKEVLTESKQGPDEESEAFAEPKEDMHEELYSSGWLVGITQVSSTGWGWPVCSLQGFHKSQGVIGLNATL